MLITPHTVVGVAIATQIQQPILALPLAFGSHFVLDAIPHWQEVVYPGRPTWTSAVRMPIDIAASVLIIYLASKHYPEITNLIWLGAFFANLPDLSAIYYIKNTKPTHPLIKKYYLFHTGIQRESTTSTLGVITQLITIALGLSIIF